MYNQALQTVIPSSMATEKRSIHPLLISTKEEFSRMVKQALDQSPRSVPVWIESKVEVTIPASF